jgi:hypothetical protein
MLLSALLLSGCAPEPEDVPEEEKSAILAFTEPMVDAQMAAIANRDYDAYGQNISEELKDETTPGTFEQLTIWLLVKAGDYQSREVTSVSQTEDYYLVTYQTVFSKDDSVVMQVAFDKGAPNRIAGMWFDSPRMRE